MTEASCSPSWELDIVCVQELARNTLPLRTEGCHLTSERAAPAGIATAVLNIALAAAASASHPLTVASLQQRNPSPGQHLLSCRVPPRWLFRGGG